MTHSPTPTELLALKTAHAATSSKDASYDLVSTVVFALGSAQLLQSPETAAELARLAAANAAHQRNAERRAAENEALERRARALQEENAELTAHVEFRMKDIKRLRARVAELEAERGTLVAARDDQIIAWLGKKAREYGTSNREARDKAEAVGRMADKLSRGAVPLPEPAPVMGPGQRRLAERTFAELDATHYRRLGIAPPASSREDPHDSPLHHAYTTGRDLPEAPRG